MPVKVNEFTIQAQFDDENESTAPATASGNIDIHALKEEIIKECMEKVEDYLERKEKR